MTPLERAKTAALVAATQHGVHADILEHITTGGMQIRPNAIEAMIRAAFEAVRGPSEAMEKAYWARDWGLEQIPALDDVWPAMIDAMLEEGA